MLVPDPDLSGDLILRTADFEMRPLARIDAPDLLTHFSDPAVTEFLDIDPLTRLDEAEAIIAWAQGLRAFGGGMRWAIRAVADGSLAGTCGFNTLIVERGRRGEIAYDLARSWWGRGAMARIMPVLMAFGFERLALHRLEAMVTPGNARSCRLLERHGFQREGVLHGHGWWRGRYHDQIVYGRLSDRDAA